MGGTNPGFGDKEEVHSGELMASSPGEQGILSPERELLKMRRKNWMEYLANEKVVLGRLREGRAGRCKTSDQRLRSES